MKSQLINDWHYHTGPNQRNQTNHHLKLLQFKLPPIIADNQLGQDADPNPGLPRMADFYMFMNSILSHTPEVTSTNHHAANFHNQDRISFVFGKQDKDIEESDGLMEEPGALRQAAVTSHQQPNTIQRELKLNQVLGDYFNRYLDYTLAGMNPSYARAHFNRLFFQLQPHIETQFNDVQRLCRQRLAETIKIMNYKDLVLHHAQKQVQQKMTSKKRGSSYIGVSTNSHAKLQVIFKYDGQIQYMGNYSDTHRAAIVYDITIIQLKGLEATTNFDYNKAQVQSILLQPNLLSLCRSQ